MRQLQHKLKKLGIDLNDGSVVKVGKGANHAEFKKSDGSLRFRGTSTVFRDMVNDLFGSKLESEAGKVGYDYDENIMVFSPGGVITTSADRVGGNHEINHDLKVGTSITFSPHLHWFQDIVNETSVVDEDITAPVVGLSVVLDHVPVDGTVVIQDATDTDTLEEDTDYEVDYVTGAITNLTMTPAATYHVDYDYIAGTATVVDFVMTLQYRVQRNGEEKATAWTTLTCEVGSGGDDIFDFSDQYTGTYNQKSYFPDITINCGISDMIQFRMTRTDSETGDMNVVFFDLHGEVDSLGSETVSSKEI